MSSRTREARHRAAKALEPQACVSRFMEPLHFPKGEATVNAELLLELGRLWRVMGDESVRLGPDTAVRVLHVCRGVLIGADSNVPAEGLRWVLVHERRLGAATVRMLEQTAAGKNATLAEAAISHGAVTRADLEATLARLVKMRFERAVAAPGPLECGPLAATGHRTHLPLAPLLVGLFRESVSPNAAQTLLRGELANGRALDTRALASLIDHLGLDSHELRLAQALALGAPVGVAVENPSAVKLVGALMVLCSRLADTAAPDDARAHR